MKEWSELRCLAAVAAEDGPWEPRLGMTDSETEFATAATPFAIIGLIAENDQLRAEVERQSEQIAIFNGQFAELHAARNLLSRLASAGFPLGEDATESILAMRAEVEALRKSQSQAAADVLAERRRQVEAEGWTPEHDDEHAGGELAEAAACYALGSPEVGSLMLWPWDAEWWKRGTTRRNQVKAAALILAEIERLDRAAMAAKEGV